MKHVKRGVMTVAVMFGVVAYSEEAPMPNIVDGTHGYMPESYVEVTDPLVKMEIENFRDRKLALMLHFGIYSQLGIHESWPLVDAEARWSRALVDWADGETLKKQYLGMWKSFNPVRLEPDRWADLAKKNGFRYLVLTTKHHDGFCLFDSKYTDFKVTNPECPFSKDPRADIVRNVYNAFRKEGLAISCYFSKPDWHHPDYWDNCGLGWKTTRWPSYDVKKDPVRWARFVEFTRNQILELVKEYGPFECLWLDGGQVQRRAGLDINIEEIVAEARKIRPGLIVADRTAGGMAENIITPEQTVPDRPLDVPWESCVTMGTGFSYRYDDNYKSPRELIHLLIDVVAKGGNLALNVAPGPDGRLPRPAIVRMEAMGAWLKKNGAAIYGTRALTPYRKGDWAFTRGADGAAYAIRLWKDRERHAECVAIPKEFDCAFVRRVVHLPTASEIPFDRLDKGFVLHLPSELETDEFAETFRFERDMSTVRGDGIKFK